MAETENNSNKTAEPAAPKKPEGEAFVIPVLPLQNTTLFPETMVPLSVGRPGSMAAVEAALASEEKLLACISVRPNASRTAMPSPKICLKLGRW
jgi:ATP-dependent Lon protease